MASDVARHYRIIFNKGQVRLAHGLENNDNMVRNNLSVSMAIEGSPYYQALFSFEKLCCSAALIILPFYHTRNGNN